MKRLTGYYIPRTSAAASAYVAQFKKEKSASDANHLEAENSIHFPDDRACFGYDTWQEILKSGRSYPGVLEIFNSDKQTVASLRIASRRHLATCFGWYWDKSIGMTLGYRFIPESTRQ